MPRLSAPTRTIFVVTLILAVIALITFFVMAFPQNSQVAFWAAMAAYRISAWVRDERRLDGRV
jgi:hypothetical protein